MSYVDSVKQVVVTFQGYDAPLVKFIQSTISENEPAHEITVLIT